MSEIYDDLHNNSTRYIRQHVSETAPILDRDDDDDSSEKSRILKPALWTSLVAGGIAGVVVDFTLYPLDTIKTRLQSEVGFKDAGGFKKMYKGMLPVLLCSAPVSAVFFCVYNSVVNLLKSDKSLYLYDPFVYIVAASTGEVLCSTIRVPLEILKQRKQTSDQNSTVILKKAIQKEGILGLYRGFSSTIIREVPFACIQFPLWEYLLQELIIYQNGQPLTALQTAYCGAVAGATAGAMTTPVDVLKTRIMLAEKEKIEKYRPYVYKNFMKEVYLERGLTGFFSGLVPRTAWIMLGGFIYFGTYEQAKLLIELKWCFFKRKIEQFRESFACCISDGVGRFLERFYCKEEDPNRVLGTNQANIATNEVENPMRGQTDDFGSTDREGAIPAPGKTDNIYAPTQVKDDTTSPSKPTQSTPQVPPPINKTDDSVALHQTDDVVVGKDSTRKG